VLRLIAEGVRSPAIAEEMQVSVATIEVHRRNIMRKTRLAYRGRTGRSTPSGKESSRSNEFFDIWRCGDYRFYRYIWRLVPGVRSFLIGGSGRFRMLVLTRRVGESVESWK